MKMDADEKELLKSVERGDWKSAAGGKRERTRYSRYAKATFGKDVLIVLLILWFSGHMGGGMIDPLVQCRATAMHEATPPPQW